MQILTPLLRLSGITLATCTAHSMLESNKKREYTPTIPQALGIITSFGLLFVANCLSKWQRARAFSQLNESKTDLDACKVAMPFYISSLKATQATQSTLFVDIKNERLYLLKDKKYQKGYQIKAPPDLPLGIHRIDQKIADGCPIIKTPFMLSLAPLEKPRKKTPEFYIYGTDNSLLSEKSPSIRLQNLAQMKELFESIQDNSHVYIY